MSAATGSKFYRLAPENENTAATTENNVGINWPSLTFQPSIHCWINFLQFRFVYYLKLG